MAKRIEFTEEQIKEIIRLYNEEMLGTPTIGKIFGVHKAVINRTLKENSIEMGPSGRKYKGGREAAQKRYNSNPNVKEKRKKYHKGWAKKNRENLREYHAKWRDENREHIRIKSRKWIQNKRLTDSEFRFKDRFRTAIYTCLKEANINKEYSTFDMLDYTLKELMEHLEKQFTKNMTWDNYGEWHVDHIIPMCKFKFDSVEDKEFKECWKLSNLQPLWGPDNLEKGSKVL